MPDPETHRPSVVRFARPLVAAEVALSLLLGFITIGSKSLWLDEAYSATAASGSWQSLYRSLRLSDANMALYDILLHVWRTVGSSDATLRTLSVVAAAASVLAVFAIGRRLFGDAVGLLAGLFMAIAPFAVRHSQQVRSYSLAVLLVSLASYLFLRAIERPRWLPWTAYAVVASLAVYAHFFAAFVLVAHALSLLFLRERPWGYLWATAAAILLLLAPGVYVAATGRQGQLSWLARPGLRTVFGQPTRLAGGVALALVFVVLLAVAARFAHLQWRDTGASFATWRLALLFSWLAVPAALALLYSWLISAMYLDRYLIVSLPALVLLAAVGVAHIPPRWAIAATLAIVVLSSVSIIGWYREASREDWREATSFTTSASQRGDGVVFCGARRPFEYYVLQDRAAGARLTPLYPPDPWQVGIHRETHPPQSGDEHWPDRVWVVEGHQDPRLTHRSTCGLSTPLRGYELARSRAFDHVWVQLYTRSASAKPGHRRAKLLPIDTARHLSDAQRVHFSTQGYVAPIRVLSSAEVTAARTRVEQLIDECADAESTAALLRTKVHLRCPTLLELVHHPAIVEPVSDLLGPDVLCRSASVFFKEPGGPAFVAWHQDAAYYELDPPDVATAWVALSDSTFENGALEVLPGSHRVPLLAHGTIGDPANMLSRGQAITAPIDATKVVTLLLQAGEISIHDVRLAHGSSRNRSPGRRLGFAIRYVAAHVRKTGLRRDTAILVKGTDRYGNFDPEPTR